MALCYRPYLGKCSRAPLARHLLRARDLADAHYAEPMTVADSDLEGKGAVGTVFLTVEDC